jgi:uncharacterized membrane protein
MMERFKHRVSRGEFLKALHAIMRQPHLVFLIIGGLFGILYIFLVPPILQPDEIAHFNRVYQISEGHLVGQKIPGGYGAYIPKTVDSFETQDFELLYNPSTQRTSLEAVFGNIIHTSPTFRDSDKKPLEFVNTEVYSPVLYAPQVVGMVISRVINLSVADTLYVVRCFGFIAWLVICAYGIRKMGQFGWAAIILLLTPLCLQLVAAVTADSMTIAFSVLFIGLIVDAITADKLGSRKIGLLLLATFLLAWTKVPYPLFAALLLLIPTAKFKNLKQRIYVLAVCALIILCITGAWSLVGQKEMAIPYRTLTTGIEINQKAQEAYILRHPLSFIHKLYDTYVRSNPYSSDPLWAYVGVLGAIGYTIPNWAVCLYFVLVGAVFVALRNNAKRSDFLSTKSRAYVICLVAVIFLAINALIFITWSRIKLPVIEGIQSRYFIPLAPLLLFVFLPILKKETALPRSFYMYVPALLITIQLATLMAVYYQFYATPMPVISG